MVEHHLQALIAKQFLDFATRNPVFMIMEEHTHNRPHSPYGVSSIHAKRSRLMPNLRKTLGRPEDLARAAVFLASPRQQPRQRRSSRRRWGLDRSPCHSHQHAFENGRQFSAWLGLVPRQNSSGGKSRLLSTSKRADPDLRTLLIHGAQSVVFRAKSKTDKRSPWIIDKQQRLGTTKACRRSQQEPSPARLPNPHAKSHCRKS